MDDKKDDNVSHVQKTKKEIAERNKDNTAINSHVTTLEGGGLGLVIIYKDGTYDKHMVQFNRQTYVTFIDNKAMVVKFKNKIYKMVPVEGEQSGE